MAFDKSKEEVFTEESVELSDGIIVTAKVYAYDGGNRRFSAVFEVPKKDDTTYFTKKFPSFTSKKDIGLMLKTLKEAAKEL